MRGLPLIVLGLALASATPTPDFVSGADHLSHHPHGDHGHHPHEEDTSHSGADDTKSCTLEKRQEDVGNCFFEPECTPAACPDVATEVREGLFNKIFWDVLYTFYKLLGGSHFRLP